MFRPPAVKIRLECIGMINSYNLGDPYFLLRVQSLNYNSLHIYSIPPIPLFIYFFLNSGRARLARARVTLVRTRRARVRVRVCCVRARLETERGLTDV